MLRYFLLILISFCLIGCVQINPYDFYNGRQNFLNKNYKIARLQLMGPAEAGIPEAQYAVGYMYLNGLGTPADEEEALFWITLSAKQCYPPAQKAYRIIKPEIDELEVYDHYAEPNALPKTQYIKKYKHSKIKHKKRIYRKKLRVKVIRSLS